MRPNPKKFGRNLTRLRNARGLNQAQLAKAVGVSQACISQWESGKVWPSVPKSQALARFFRISADWLLFQSM